MRPFTGTWALVRLALRRDRVQLPIWLLAIAGSIAATASSAISIYGVSDQAIAGYATTGATSVVARAFNGAISGPSLGAIVAAESYFLLALLVPLMSTLLVVRHTRQNEETGRAELLGSAVVGRLAGLTAALLVALAANVAAGLLLTAAFVGNDLPLAGSLALSGAVALAGTAFAAIAAVAAQLAPTARMANGLAVGAIGLAFGMRALGDAYGDVGADGMSVTSAWPSWLSPLGWISQIQPYGTTAWWTLGLPVLVVLLAVWLAFWLVSRRDVGFGLLADRRGPATAGAGLRGTLGLAWRLQRGTLLAWLLGFLLMAVPMGAVTNEVDDMLANNPQAVELIQALGGLDDVIDAFFGAMLMLMGLAASGYALQALLRMRAEETGGQLEGVLAGAVSRPRWLGGHLLVAVLGAALLLAAAGAGMGLGYAATGGPGSAVAELTGAALVFLPAVLVLVGFVVAVFGWLPQAAVGLAWGGLAACLLLGQIGALLELPQLLLDLSPFTHVPQVPADSVAAPPLLIMLGVAALLLSAGTAGFRRRDLQLA
ncbi:anibiotic ABC transporter [Catellatospora sp. NPDC049609]|uniref:ABC transporter permease n=1 Tax=Catellatospora sp. NPDC049609 TaxID=3155505 RepID=UPI00341DE7C3